MNKKTANQVAKEMQAAGFETSLAHWSETNDYSVNGKDTATGYSIRIDNMEQWQDRKATIEANKL